HRRADARCAARRRVRDRYRDEPLHPVRGPGLVGSSQPPPYGGDHDMSTQEAPVDVDVLRSEIQKTYTDVSTEPERDFIFPTGRAWAEELGYPQPELSRVPDSSAESFAGVANHFLLGRIEPGATV